MWELEVKQASGSFMGKQLRGTKLVRERLSDMCGYYQPLELVSKKTMFTLKPPESYSDSLSFNHCDSLETSDIQESAKQ